MIAVDYAAHCPNADALALKAILELLRERIGTDFSCYRAATVRRRILNRMISVGVESFTQYLDMLRGAEGEPLRLLERLTIKVSRFYRNKPAWDLLRTEVLPRLAHRAAPLRLWSAGCGCGEEPYTLAMLLDEAGIAGTIEASDVDPSALHAARAGRYSAAAVAELPPDLLSRYLEESGDGYAVLDSLRQRVRYSQHDLTSRQPPPGADEAFDLVCCRNVLIYFDRTVQEQALQLLRDSVRDDGYLFLGEAEWPMPPVAGTLQALNRPARIFRAAERAAPWMTTCTDIRI
jgi:chemotaxis methyl-accepting protein methylase